MKNVKLYVKNKYLILAILEIIVVAVITVALCLPKYSHNFTSEDINVLMGEITESGSIYTDNNMTSSGILLTTPEMELGYGSYIIEINYDADTDGNMAYITLPDIMAGRENINDRFVTNTLQLSSHKQSDSFEVLINTKQKDYQVAVFFMGNGSLAINSINIVETYAGILRIAVILIVVFVIINLGMLFVDRRRQNQISVEAVHTCFCLAGIILFASIPLMLDYMIEGHDLTFHLLRIEGLKEGMIMGTFPIKIQPNWLSGNGYATSVFYGDVLLYIPAILRLCGFNVTESYNIYVFLTNVATCLVSYYCFLGISKNRKAAITGSALYTLSLYRLINIFVRSAVGEYSAMIFLPLIAYGMWKIFTEDIKADSYKKNWIIPVIGFSGIINTHILTCEMAGAFILLLCIILIKKVLKKEIFIVLVKIVLYTCIVNAGFLVPFFDYMLEGGFIVTNGDRFSAGIQQFGAFLGQLFVPFTTFSGLSENVSEGMAGELPSSTGLALIIGAIVFVYVWVMGYVKEKRYKALAGICLAFGALSLWFSTHLFPWDIFQDMNGLFEKLISMISMPWRFLSIASLMLAIVTVVAIRIFDLLADEAVVEDIREADKKSKSCSWIITVLIAICVIQTGSLMSDLMNNSEPLQIYSDSALDDANVIGGEYLPNLGILDIYTFEYEKASENLQMSVIDRYNNKVRMSVVNNSHQAGTLNLSMVYYKGYTARDAATNEKFEVYPENGFTVGVVIPQGYSGEVRVEFEGFWYWKLAAVISIISVLVIGWLLTGRKIKLPLKSK